MAAHRKPQLDVFRQDLGGMDAWTRHRHFIDTYVKHYQKDTPQSRQDAKTELDILHENHRFLRSEQDDQDLTWEKRIAKKYYDKLFKEFALVELKYYKDGRIAMRWRTENEVVRGKGQFTCGSLRCDESDGLQDWEVNFGYVEQGEKKNALVKIRLCERCSYKLNYKKTHNRAKSHQEGSSSGKSRRSSHSRSTDNNVDSGDKDDQEQAATGEEESRAGTKKRSRGDVEDGKEESSKDYRRERSRGSSKRDSEREL